MDIARLAKHSGVPASTLRFYEAKGLIASVGRAGLKRVFAPGTPDRLALIALGRAAGFSLGDIAAMLSPPGKPRIDRKALAAKADELDAKIAHLKAVREGLRHAAACPAPSHLECPTFRRLMAQAIATPKAPPRAPVRTRPKP